MKKSILLIALFFMIGLPLMARKGEDSLSLILKEIANYTKLRDSVKSAMNYKAGVIQLPSGIVQLNVPKGFKYLGLEQSRYVVEKLWRNLPQPDLQGMIFPEKGDPFDDSSYAYIITYNQVGFIKDDDAKDINYDELMKNMQKDDIEENAKRKAMGSAGIFTEGWAAKPYYDDQKKVLHWALDLKLEDQEEHTLNYKIISLGRKGMLTMNAISTTNQLGMVKADVDKVINMADFTDGNKYKDYDSNVDQVAAWTVGGLVAGKILAKTVAGKSIFAFLKYIIMAIVAAVAGGWKWITGRRKKELEIRNE